MDVSITETDSGVSIVVPAGDLDHQTAPQLKDQIEKQLKKGSSQLVIDCSRLTYISSYGLTVLVELHKTLEADGGQLKLAHTTGGVADVLNITGLKRFFEVYPTVDAATDSFACD